MHKRLLQIMGLILALILIVFIIETTALRIMLGIDIFHKPSPEDRVGKTVVIEGDTLSIIRYLPAKKRYLLSDGTQIVFKE